MLNFRPTSPPPARRPLLSLRRLLTIALLAALIGVLVLRGKSPTPSPTPADPVAQEQIAHDLATRGEVENESEPSVIDPRLLFPGIDAEQLAKVRDNTVFRAIESNAWFQILALLQKTEAATLRSAAPQPLSFLQLDRQASAYRGRVVSITGTLRAAKKVDAPRNEHGIQDYFQLWIQPDRETQELVVVYSLTVPDDLPLHDTLDTPAEVTGIFFKRWAYPARGGVMTAPLILARSITWHPADLPVPQPALGQQVLTSVGLALLVAILVISAIALRSRKRRHQDLPAAVSLENLPLPAAPSASQDDARANPPTDRGA